MYAKKNEESTWKDLGTQQWVLILLYKYKIFYENILTNNKPYVII